jgi:F-box domain
VNPILNEASFANIPFEILLEIFQYLTPDQLFPLRLVSHTFKAASNSIVLRKLVNNSLLQVEVSYGPSIPVLCKAINSTSNFEFCEWRGNAKHGVSRVWDSLYLSSTTIQVIPSSTWMWYCPDRYNYERCCWTDIEPIPSSSPHKYDEISDKEKVFWRKATGWIQMPWTLRFKRVKSLELGTRYSLSVKLPVWALMKIYRLYREKFWEWESWQPQNLTADTVFQASFYLSYFTRVQFGDKTGSNRFPTEFLFEDVDIHGICKLLQF